MEMFYNLTMNFRKQQLHVNILNHMLKRVSFTAYKDIVICKIIIYIHVKLNT